MSTEPEKPTSSPSSDLPESLAPVTDSESASAPPPAETPAEWPPHGSWRRAPVLPLAVIAAVVIILVAAVSSMAGVLVGVVATKNADSHSRIERHHGPYGPGWDRPRDHRRGPWAVPTTPAAPAPPPVTTPTPPVAPTQTVAPTVSPS